MGGEHAMEQYKVCIGPNLTCMNDLLNRMGQFDHVDYKGGLVKCRDGEGALLFDQLARSTCWHQRCQGGAKRPKMSLKMNRPSYAMSVSGKFFWFPSV